MLRKTKSMLSVIVPVYNVEAYLSKCLDSILAQTFTNFEVICVNDGSTDGSLNILTEYAQKDVRVKVASQKNGGSTSARKTGAKLVSGDYVLCIDADDWIEETYLEKLMEAGGESGADIVVADLYYVIDSNISVHRNMCQKGFYYSCELWPEMISKLPFFEFGILPNLVVKLIKSDLFCRSIQEIDEKIVIGEDAALSYNCLLQSSEVLITDICGYYYIQRNNSNMKTYTNNEYEGCMRLIRFLELLDAKYCAKLSAQIKQYQKFLMLFRCPERLDINLSDCILEPYGGIPIGTRVVLYGAGGAGRAIYAYLKSSKKVDVILWTDRNFALFQRDGLPVDPPVRIAEFSNRYDLVVIAVTSKRVAKAIRQDICALGVPDEKIRWLTKGFIES